MDAAFAQLEQPVVHRNVSKKQQKRKVAFAKPEKQLTYTNTESLSYKVPR